MPYDEKTQRVQAEIEEKIEEMEQPGYHFPKRFGARDYAAVCIVAGICLFFLIWGAFL